MKTKLSPFVVLLSWSLLAAVRPGLAAPPLTPEVRLFGMSFDNFFWAPEGSPKEAVQAGTVEGRLAALLRPDSRLEAYGRAGYTAYEGALEDSSALGAGLRSGGRPQAFDVFVGFEQDLPSLDVGDEFDRADVLRFTGEYSYRLTRDWQVTALGDFQQQEFAVTRGKDNDLYQAGAALRYRGWGSVFSPEIGVEAGERSAKDRNEDHDQLDLWLKLRSAPIPSLYLSLRFRHRSRDYSASDPLAGNFGREDERREWTLAADLATGARLKWNLYYSYLDAESTKASRTFTSGLLGLGVTLGLSRGSPEP